MRQPNDIVYLDNAATTPVLEHIAADMKEIMVHDYGNPSSLHQIGLAAARHVRSARTGLASLLGVGEDGIIFTSGASEANNLALLGAALARKRKGRHIVYSAIEHPSVLETMKFLGQNGFEAQACPVNKRGLVEAPVLQEMIRTSTVLISIMLVNNEIGSVQNLAALVKAARSLNPQIVFHSDCVQALGKMEVKPRQLGIDMLSLSAHKLGGPKGIGAMYIRKGTPWKSLSLGGGQEGGRRSGTENVPGIAGFAMAAQEAWDKLKFNRQHMEELKQSLLRLLTERGLPFAVNGPEPSESAPHIINLSFPGVRGEVLAHFLERDGVYVSTGSACSSNKTKHSHVLTALNLPAGRADSAIRISFSPLNEQRDIICLVQALQRALKHSSY